MRWWTRWRMGAVCADYKALLDRFLDGAMPTETFRTLYFKRFQEETRYMCSDLFEVLDGLFADLDGLTDDPELLAAKPDYFIDEARLRERVQAASRRLASFTA